MNMSAYIRYTLIFFKDNLMHYYSFNVTDYTYDTRHLTLAEHGALRLLIDRYHLIEKPLDADEENIFRLMCFDKEEDKEVIRRMLKEFFVKKKNGWTHKQSEIDIRFYKSQSERGKRGAEARWHKESHASAMLTNNQKPTNKNHNTAAITSIETKSLLKDFNDFWEIYPRKNNIDQAREAWLIMKPSIDKVLTALNWQINSNQWQAENGRYIPNAAKYISEKRWEQENTEPPSGVPLGMVKKPLTR